MASFAMKSMTDHTHELTVAFSREPMSVAGVLLDKKLIQNEVLLKMMKLDTSTAKGAVLVEAVLNVIAVAPEKFEEFLEIISDQPWAKQIANKLHSTYQSKSAFDLHEDIRMFVLYMYTTCVQALVMHLSICTHPL